MAEQETINFQTYIMLIGSQIMVHLGKAPNPATGEMDKNSSLAKTEIDILKLLSQKTEGNLTENEKELLDSTIQAAEKLYGELA